MKIVAGRKTNVDEVDADQNEGLEPAAQEDGFGDPDKTVRLTMEQSLEAQISGLAISMHSQFGDAWRNRERLAIDMSAQLGTLQQKVANLHRMVIMSNGQQMEVLGMLHEQNANSPIVRIFAAVGIVSVVGLAVLVLNNLTAVVTALFG